MRLLISMLIMVPALIISGCLDGTDDNGGTISLTGVYVVNEGNFGQGNGSLTIYNPQTNQITQNAFELANERPLGDVPNDMIFFDNRGYIVVNNSDRLEIVDLDDLKSETSVSFTGSRSPYRISIDPIRNLAFVTHLYDNAVSFIDINGPTITREVQVGNNPTGLIAMLDRVFVLNSGFGNDSTMSIIDIASGSIEKTVTVGHGPMEIVADASGIIWILCTGQFGDWTDPSDQGTPGSLYRFFVGNDDAERWTEFTSRPSRMSLGPDEYIYVVTDEGVDKVSMIGMNAREQIIPGSFYGIQSDWFHARLYVSDAGNFVSPGTVYAYTLGGQLTDSFTAGIIPGRILFTYGN